MLLRASIPKTSFVSVTSEYNLAWRELEQKSHELIYLVYFWI